MNSIFWVGTKESDIVCTGFFFQGSVTACGSGRHGNQSFSNESRKRINYNAANDEYTEYLQEKIGEIIRQNSASEIMYFNPYYAHFLDENLQRHVCCLNSKPILDVLRSKCEMRIMASEYIPIVPFARVLGKDVASYITQSPNTQKYIIQENISSGGEGTYLVSSREDLPVLSDQGTYLVSKYYDKSISININFLVFDDEIILFPPSVQIIRSINGKMMFSGSDYFIEKYHNYFRADEVFDSTLKTAENLRKIGYRGICGFDYIASPEGLMFLECNPRFQASSFLLNLVLDKIGLPSVQEMNYMAFHHDKAPEFDFASLQIPFSCIAVSDKRYLSPIMPRPEWSEDKNVVEILDDGFGPNLKCENDAYLYRIIFSASITDLNPEHEIVTFDNLVQPSEDWYSKIMSNDLLALKISLLNQGIYIPQETHNYLKKTGGIKTSVFDSIDIILPNHMIINCPYKINYADFSPFSIEEADGKLRLYFYNTFLHTITLEHADPHRERRTIGNGVPYRRLSYLGGDRLRIHHTDICVFKKNKKPCRFCNLPVNGFHFSLDDIYEVIDFYLHQGGFRHILIGGGSERIDYETDTILKLVKYIRRQTDMPIYVMCLPVTDKKILRELYMAGVTEIGFNLEIWETENAEKLMPGKGKLPRQDYINSLKNAVQIWQTPGSVRSLLIVGLERREILKNAVKTFCSEGIMPILSVFRPLPETEMELCLPPSNEFLYSVYQELDQICSKYGQHLGPDCFCCQNNTLSLPW